MTGIPPISLDTSRLAEELIAIYGSCLSQSTDPDVAEGAHPGDECALMFKHSLDIAFAGAAQQIRTLREPPRRFPIQDGPSVPWSLMEPHERQALENHDQTLQRLAERGGLSPYEAVALLEDRKQQAMDHAEATRQLQAFIDNDLTAKFEAQIRTLLQLFLCEQCVDNHGENPQSVSCYCPCHNSTRDETRWPLVRETVLKALRG